MPLYEYECRSCANRFELLVRGREQPECPGCRGSELDRRFSVFAARTGGAAQTAVAQPMASGGCGSCGDPRGPGACSMN